MNYGKKGTSKKQKSVNAKSVKIRKKAGVIFIKTFLICIVAVGVIGLCAGIGVAKGIIDNAPNITSESVIPTGFKSKMYDAQGNKVAELVAAGSNRTWVDIENVPEYVLDAFIAIEDERFKEHNGIDMKGIIRAGVKGVASGFKFTEGASTITQQLLKNSVFNFMEEDTLMDSVERKIQEQYLAIELEKVMSKEEILESYLNTINLGQNTLGIQAASNRYFNKDVSDLTLSEATVIAGITKNPSGYNPVKYPEENEKRRTLVLNAMLEQELITKTEYDEAMEDDVYSRIKNADDEAGSNVYSYFVDAAIAQIIEDLQEEKGYTPQQASNLVYNGGLSIETTQDPAIQKIMDEELSNPENYPDIPYVGLEYALTVVKPDGEQKNYSQEMMQAYFRETESSKFELVFKTEEEAQEHIDAYKESIVEDGDTVYERVEMTVQPQTSMVVLDHNTGHVVGIIGGRGEKEASLTLNRATDTMRQPGSTFKIVAGYAPALDAAGMTLATTQYDAPFAYSDGAGKMVRNWNGEVYEGWTTLRRGIYRSMNIVAVKTITDITPALGISYLQNFGISTLQVELDENGNSDGQQAMVLGGITKGVTNLELTAAYGTIANEGVYIEPKFYTRILDQDGNVVIDNTAPNSRQVLRESTAWLLTSAMKDVVTIGTGTAVNFGGMSIAGKTGTTSSYNDIWFEGYTPYYTAGTWGGYDNNHKLDGTERSYPKVIWKAVMSRIHEELPNESFNKPSTVTSAVVCAASGKLPIPGICDGTLSTEYFEVGTVPTEYCNVHVIGTACVESGMLATDACPGHEERIMTLVPNNSIDIKDVTGLGDTLIAPSCGLHLGTPIGGYTTPMEGIGIEIPEDQAILDQINGVTE